MKINAIVCIHLLFFAAVSGLYADKGSGTASATDDTPRISWTEYSEKHSSKNLLAGGFTGLSALLSGIALLGYTGAARNTAPLFAALSLGGAALWINSWYANLYGLSGGTLSSGTGHRPRFEGNAGYAYIYDPRFDYRHLAHIEASAIPGRLKLKPGFFISVNDSNWKADMNFSWRFLGYYGNSEKFAGDASFLDLEATFYYHRYGTENFSVINGEIFLNGRLDLVKIASYLRGAFTEAGAGYAMGLYRFDAAAGEFPGDSGGMLLFRFGPGIYLGRGQGEIMIFYDHRKDAYTGGFLSTGVGGGILGHAGFKGKYFIHKNTGIYCEILAGSSLKAEAGISWRYTEQTCEN